MLKDVSANGTNKWGDGVKRNVYALLYLKWVTYEDLLYSTGNSAQYHITT